ncbi:MAG: DUF433 domain-containing protein [Hymenobacter sp.]|nr:MAG: DUF433 domain-containing protein [Hymenobacter sp.]
MLRTDLITIDPKITGGTPTFTGTRVAIETLFEYLAAGEPLDEFLASFPSVSREHATAVLQAALVALLPAHLLVEPAQIDFSFTQAVPHEAAAS